MQYMVMISVPYFALPDVGKEVGGLLEGKPVIDTCNPFAMANRRSPEQAGLIMALTAWETYVEDRVAEGCAERLSQGRGGDGREVDHTSGEPLYTRHVSSASGSRRRFRGDPAARTQVAGRRSWRRQGTMDRETEGGCLCGTARYRVTGEPLFTTLCHCRTCRRASGAPSLAWVILRADDFVVTSGSPVQFQSSPGAIRTFCGTCGTSLTYQRTSRPDLVDVTTISFDHPDDFPPDREIWIEEKVAWQTLNDALRHFTESSLGAEPIESE